MIKRKKVSKIFPQFIKDKNGKTTEVLLKYSVYETILDEMNQIEKRIAALKQKAVRRKKS